MITVKECLDGWKTLYKNPTIDKVEIKEESFDNKNSIYMGTWENVPDEILNRCVIETTQILMSDEPDLENMLVIAIQKNKGSEAMECLSNKVCITSKLYQDMSSDASFFDEVNKCIRRFFSNDWGDSLSDSDILANKKALETRDDNVYGFYDTSKGKINIVMESDHTLTTVLYEEEY